MEPTLNFENRKRGSGPCQTVFTLFNQSKTQSSLLCGMLGFETLRPTIS